MDAKAKEKLIIDAKRVVDFISTQDETTLLQKLRDLDEPAKSGLIYYMTLASQLRDQQEANSPTNTLLWRARTIHGYLSAHSDALMEKRLNALESMLPGSLQQITDLSATIHEFWRNEPDDFEPFSGDSGHWQSYFTGGSGDDGKWADLMQQLSDANAEAKDAIRIVTDAIVSHWENNPTS